MIHKYNTANYTSRFPFINTSFPINTPLNQIIPLIYIDMGKVIDDMCKKLGKTVSELDKSGYIFDLGDYGIENSTPISWYSDISDSEYILSTSLRIDNQIKEIEEEYAKKAFDGFDLNELKNSYK